MTELPQSAPENREELARQCEAEANYMDCCYGEVPVREGIRLLYAAAKALRSEIAPARLKVFEEAFARFPVGQDIYGSYSDWKDALEVALNAVPPAPSSAGCVAVPKFDYGKAYADLFDLINNDSMAITFQSLGQYRSWLLQCIRTACPDAPSERP